MVHFCVAVLLECNLCTCMSTDRPESEASALLDNNKKKPQKHFHYHIRKSRTVNLTFDCVISNISIIIYLLTFDYNF